MDELSRAIAKTCYLTANDTKNDFELLASAVEELGEYAREAKIEDKSPCNSYKTPGEGTMMEAIDLTICGLALYFRRGGSVENLGSHLSKKLDKWEEKQKT